MVLIPGSMHSQLHPSIVHIEPRRATPRVASCPSRALSTLNSRSRRNDCPTSKRKRSGAHISDRGRCPERSDLP
ncbi:hypothetical protein CONPUDRAFT_90865 [Coniophora puteana RWD-64-598 SS2]|uniref:Uncharacterized protein n=1 Tax=Coniophora puteana (strain RWD-64-598) TaxID=741705 RepID=A0A5M3MK59_CONPW|nr:uncharacterized protein CONPUDRAFT_90865 [Coniophora puteana RWD-64-598 SS2]EIW79446.1 hypothetical protein CONPUDRAFT_90865 [Coniophora puteana RWD-64-598 SS2]